MLLWVLGTALAGTVVIDAKVPVDLKQGGRSVLQTWGPVVASLPDIDAGPQVYEIVRGDKSVTTTVDVPPTGSVTLTIEAARAVSMPSGDPPPDAPKVDLHAEPGFRFALVLDGQRAFAFGSDQAVRLERLAVGEHRLELRTADLVTIYNRGTLEVRPGDQLTLLVAQGRALDVLGRDGAWTAGGDR